MFVQNTSHLLFSNLTIKQYFYIYRLTNQLQKLHNFSLLTAIVAPTNSTQNRIKNKQKENKHKNREAVVNFILFYP